MPYSTRQTKQVNEKKRSRPTSAGPPSGPRAKKVKRLNANALEINSNETIEATSDITHNVNMNEDRTLEHSSALSLPASIPDKLLSIEQEMCTKLRDITFPVIAQYIYNPLEYASKVHAMYVQKYCNGTKKILFLGMNPGPWGMSQTGVPFGEIDMVSNWLKISGSVDKPPKEHPDRKVTGFQCTRSEVSGKRFWGLLQNICVIPENFFQDAYVHNYCPLALMDTKARNITPAELTKGEAHRLLHKICDKALVDIIKLLDVEIVVGIGRYAERRAQTAVEMAGLTIQVIFLPHPSPRVVGNENWDEKAMNKLKEFGLLKFFTHTDIA